MGLRINAIIKLFLIVAFLSLLSACRKEHALDCFTANGDTTSEVRQFGTFTEVEVYDKMELVVRAGTSHSVVITAGKKIIKNIKTEIRDGRLHIDNQNTCNFVRGYKRTIRVEVYMPYLKFLKNSGVGPATIAGDRVQDTLIIRAENSGDIHIDGTYDYIRTSSHGNGDVYFSGRGNTVYVYTYGTNYVHAEKIKIRDFCFVHTITLGDCIVNADSLARLECNIQGDGNVYYMGDPGTIVDYTDKALYQGRIYRKD